MIFCNAVGLLYRIGWGDFDGFTPLQAVRLSLFFGGLLALMIVRNRRANIALLIMQCLLNLAPALLPWTAAAGNA